VKSRAERGMDTATSTPTLLGPHPGRKPAGAMAAIGSSEPPEEALQQSDLLPGLEDLVAAATSGPSGGGGRR
jgi:hypothetical protein